MGWGPWRLFSTIATDCGAWRDAIDPRVEARLNGAIDTLAEFPVFDGTVLRILGLCDDPDASTAEIVAAIEHDASFAVNLLHYANSAALARPVRAKSIRQAVMLVGRRTLRRLSLEAATYRFLERAPGNGGAVRGQMHIHAIAVAVAAAAAADAGRVHGEGAHVAGLLHDVGKLVLPLAFGEDVIDEISEQHPAGPSRVQLERARLGIDHARPAPCWPSAGACPRRSPRRSRCTTAARTASSCRRARPRASRSPTPSPTCLSAPRSTRTCSTWRWTGSA